MKRFATTLIFSALLISACSIPSAGIFSRKTPHEKYADKIEDRMGKTPEGRQWLAASAMALNHPFDIQLPYQQHGQFQKNRQRAMGLRFDGTAGEQLRVSINKKPLTDFSLFIDMYRNGAEPALIFSADTTEGYFVVNIEETGEYIIRLQPQLFQAGEYSISVGVGPSLGYPVQGEKAKAGSFWGAPRDGGKRKHEGIDIFAPRSTPVIAAADGMITSVRNEGIGGKTIWLRPSDRRLSLYYAHLDEQFVQPGQSVKAGEVIGTVGNTGNAKSTPPHLHFGVYGYGGAIDPLPFVNKIEKKPAKVNQKDLEAFLKLKKAQKWKGETIPAETVVIPLAIDAKGYISELPGGRLVSLPLSAVKPFQPGDVVRQSSGATAP